MRAFVLGTVLATCSALPAQSTDWQRIVQPFHMDRLRPERLSPEQQARLKALLLQTGTGWQGCEGDTSWLDNLKVSQLPSVPRHGMLVEAGMGCARGGQGSNGAMWVVQWRNSTPILLGHMDGWFYQVLPSQSHGLPDLTAGWHMSGAEFGLTLYRFDGKRYRRAAGTDVTCPDDYDLCTAKPTAGEPLP